MMQKKQYEAIAAAIRATPTIYMNPKDVKIEIAGKIAAALFDSSGDPTFDRARFLKACGVEE